MHISPIHFDNDYLNQEILKFTNFINWTIASETPIKYSGSQILSDGSLIIHSQTEKIFKFSGIETILKFWREFDFSHVKTEIKRIYRMISEMMDINRLYTIRNMETKEFSNIFFKEFKYEKIKFQDILLKDGSRIVYIVDPYCKGFGIFQDISKPFKDFDLGYNYLHLYEHMMCLPWKKTSKDETTITMNGFTTDVGISVVYNVVSTEEKFRDSFYMLVRHYFKSRTENYWKKHYESLKIESMRTVSETFEERTLHDYFRSDPSVYSCGYNIDVFRYWSGHAFSCLLVSPKEVSLNFKIIEKLSKTFPNETKRPKDEIFDVIPIETIKKKINYKYRIQKMTGNDFKSVLSGEPCDFMSGIDVKHVFNVEFKDTSSILYPLLFLRQKVNIEKVIKNIVLPMNVVEYRDFKIIIPQKNKIKDIFVSSV